MLDIFTEKNIDMYLGYFGTTKSSYKRNKILFATIGLLIGFLFAIASGKAIVYGVAVVLGFIGYKLPFVLIRSSKNKQDIINRYMFPDFLQSFLAIISSTGNVYTTLVETRKYLKEPLLSEIDKLIDLIEYDNRREYYLDFADYIGTSEALMVMDMIYKFSVYGIDEESLRRITEFIDTMQRNQSEELIEKKMQSMENVGLMPLFISMILVGGYTVVMFIHYFAQGVI